MGAFSIAIRVVLAADEILKSASEVTALFSESGFGAGHVATLAFCASSMVVFGEVLVAIPASALTARDGSCEVVAVVSNPWCLLQRQI